MLMNMIEILVNDRVVAANTLEEMLDTLLESMARLLDRLQRGRRMLEHVVGNGDGGVDDEFEEIRRARFNILIGVLEGLSLKAKGVRKAYKATKALRDRCKISAPCLLFWIQTFGNGVPYDLTKSIKF
ncbi:Rx N-terminal domain-containing protein [Caenorhabditis elegans]|uniref:Rx N-terminal domain-containing protein n=1 Tax=Caenorhabditis elegans TaxID=6239 RepID=S6EZP9_CAEEL|nr:Rx N-terminal domain-containing protein [Caenorhabditis elegans]CDG24119.1 Rx N-terminal domain-containing protein [Caenorhabditis elegans]|eukprot:NP_001293279.1 Uncharacterized protein CELE_Y37E3.30 [Caenorhabditis elegans]